MKVQTIPAPTLTAIHALLSPHVPELTPSTLVDALKAYRPDAAAEPERAPKMLPLKEAAEALGLSFWTLRRMANAGTIPARKVGQQWRVPLAAVKALADTGEAR